MGVEFWGLRVEGSGPNQFLDPRSILNEINYQSPWGILTSTLIPKPKPKLIINHWRDFDPNPKP